MWWLTSYRLDLKSQASYRLDFAIQIAIWMVYASLPLVAVGVLVSKFPNSGMDVAEVALVYCAVQLGYEGSRMFARALDDFHTETSKGNLDRLLIRPKPLLPLVVASRLFPRRIAGIAAGLMGGAMGLAGTPHPTAALVMLLVATATSVLIFSGLLTIYAAICFWTITRNLFADIVTGSLVTLSLAPIENFAWPLRILVTHLIPIYPGIQCPIRSLSSSGGAITAVDFFFPIVGGAGFYAISVAMFYVGRRVYQSPGS